MARFAILNDIHTMSQTMLNESEFLHETDHLFASIEDQIDEQGLDFDCLFTGNVLTIEHADGTQIIINRHTPNQELWIAAKSGGYHFARKNQQWLASRDNSEFFAVLSQALSDVCGDTVCITQP